MPTILRALEALLLSNAIRLVNRWRLHDKAYYHRLQIPERNMNLYAALVGSLPA